MHVADRLKSVQEYYFSRKLREIKELISEGKPIEPVKGLKAIMQIATIIIGATIISILSIFLIHRLICFFMRLT